MRKAFSVKKVSSSHSRGEALILSDAPLDERKLRDAINATGYEVTGISSAPYTKKGFLGLFG